VTPTIQPGFPASAGSGVKTALVAGLLVALVAANVYLYIQLDHVRTDLAQTQEKVLNEITNLREASTVSSQAARRHLDSLRSELDTARRQAGELAGVAKTEALARAEQLAARLTAEQKRQEEQLNSQITEVKEATSTAQQQIASVGGEVSTVKTQVQSTKSELEKTIADLKRVTGDLGVQSGLIATNAKELMALKELGDRNYFEFNIKKSKQPQRIGDITLLLKKADTKRNRFTVEVMADDKKTEKKDRNINEPIQFYTLKARLPYELVVNQVNKDQIVGYLSTPKVQVSRN
jgi:chromosome segregation ATPase